MPELENVTIGIEVKKELLVSLREEIKQAKINVLNEFDSELSVMALANGWDTCSDAYEVQKRLREFIDSIKEG